MSSNGSLQPAIAPKHLHNPHATAGMRHPPDSFWLKRMLAIILTSHPPTATLVKLPLLRTGMASPLASFLIPRPWLLRDQKLEMQMFDFAKVRLFHSVAKSLQNPSETPRNSRLIVQLRMFHHVTTFQQVPLSVTLCHYVPCAVWNTQSPTQKLLWAFMGAILLTSAPPLLPKHPSCEPGWPDQWSASSFLGLSTFQDFCILFMLTKRSSISVPSRSEWWGWDCPNSDRAFSTNSTTSSM